MVRVGKLGRYLTIGRSARAAFIILSMALLASCNPATTSSSPDGAQLDIIDKVRSVDLLPHQPEPVDAVMTAPGQGGGSRPVMYQGTDVTAVSDQRLQSTSSGNGFDLNFENTPVATVAKVVLGDILGVGYTIDPRVQGTVSLVSIRPVAKSDIVFVLENALRLSGVVMIRDTAGYRLTPLGDAVGAGRVDAAGASPEPGFGVSVVPLQYVSAQTLLKLMDSFATKAGTVRADTTRNLLLIQGSGAERRTAVDTALSFDVDWMRGQSVGIFPISSGPPAPLITELEKIVDSGENGLSQNVIKFQPIARLNAIMVVSKRPEMLRTAATWIKRLDRADTARTSVHVYQVKYGDAQPDRARADRHVHRRFVLQPAGQRRQPDRAGIGHVGDVKPRSPVGKRQCTVDDGERLRRQQRIWNAPASGRRPPRHDWLRAPRTRQPARSTTATAPASGNGQPMLQDVRITPDVVNNTRADLCRSGQLPDHRSHAAAGRQAAASGRDRRDDCRSDAQQRSQLRRSILSDQQEPRTEAEPGFDPRHPGDDRAGDHHRSDDRGSPRSRDRSPTRSSTAPFPDSISWSALKRSRA